MQLVVQRCLFRACEWLGQHSDGDGVVGEARETPR